MKRVFDMTMAALGLLLLAPLLILVAIMIKLTSRGPIYFRQERVGRRFKPFYIYKFRSMVQDAPRLGGPVTFGDDPRITRLGRVLRKFKIDEFPQLFNVLKGDMSLVGPRPEVPRYVDMFREDYKIILQVRPGITDLASLHYNDEAVILGQAQDPEEEYILRVLPAKIHLAKDYIRHASMGYDLLIIAKTLATLVFSRIRTIQ